MVCRPCGSTSSRTTRATSACGYRSGITGPSGGEKMVSRGRTTCTTPVRRCTSRATTCEVAGGVGSKLVGAAHFGPGAESHRGLCHGGTMCSLMDDVIGWTGFCATGVCKPWSGFTVQINTALKKPVNAGRVAAARGKVSEAIEGRKVSVRARLLDVDGAIHCEAEGLVVLGY